jgi:hypothetical protein
LTGWQEEGTIPESGKESLVKEDHINQFMLRQCSFCSPNNCIKVTGPQYIIAQPSFFPVSL